MATQKGLAEPRGCRECGNVNHHQRDCSLSKWEDTGNDTIVRNEDREDDDSAESA